MSIPTMNSTPSSPYFPLYTILDLFVLTQPLTFLPLAVQYIALSGNCYASLLNALTPWKHVRWQ